MVDGMVGRDTWIRTLDYVVALLGGCIAAPRPKIGQALSTA